MLSSRWYGEIYYPKLKSSSVRSKINLYLQVHTRHKIQDNPVDSVDISLEGSSRHQAFNHNIHIPATLISVLHLVSEISLPVLYLNHLDFLTIMWFLQNQHKMYYYYSDSVTLKYFLDIVLWHIWNSAMLIFGLRLFCW